MEYVVGLLCVLALFAILDIALGENDDSIPNDVIRKQRDRYE